MFILLIKEVFDSGGGTLQGGEGWKEGLEQDLSEPPKPEKCHRFLAFQLQLSDCLRTFVRCSSEILVQFVRV